MYIIAIIAVIWVASALDKAVKRQKAKQAALAKQMEKEREAQRRINERLAKEQERQEKAQAAAWERQRKEDERRDAQLAKHEERISTLEFKAKQAEADILNEQSRLDHYTEKLSALDDELKRLDSDIEYYQLANKVDAENKARAAKAKVEDTIFGFEEKVRACEKRMSKAQHTKELCEKQMSA